jgi:hypothetical protein
MRWGRQVSATAVKAMENALNRAPWSSSQSRAQRDGKVSCRFPSEQLVEEASALAQNLHGHLFALKPARRGEIGTARSAQRVIQRDRGADVGRAQNLLAFGNNAEKRDG